MKTEITTLQAAILAIVSKPTKSDGDGFKRPAWTSELYDVINSNSLVIDSKELDKTISVALDGNQFDLSLANIVANAFYYPASKGCSFNEHLINMRDGFLSKHQRAIAESDENQPLQPHVWDFVTGLGFHFPEKAKGGVILATFKPRDEKTTPETYKESFFTAIQALNVKLLEMGFNPVRPEVDTAKKAYFVSIKKAKKVDLDDFTL